MLAEWKAAGRWVSSLKFCWLPAVVGVVPVTVRGHGAYQIILVAYDYDKYVAGKFKKMHNYINMMIEIVR